MRQCNRRLRGPWRTRRSQLSFQGSKSSAEDGGFAWRLNTSSMSDDRSSRQYGLQSRGRPDSSDAVDKADEERGEAHFLVL